ncbi:DCC1-like thiol-disulfide oxidoreductase family protein [Rhizobium sp. TRM95111]|uniref:thiol-disulfide oxidoreductase DCC family protein n=1 Tax=Rhizobium alarense TaxID=2846851 RepID=UPI001F436B1F|nr:DCC1-like thiol-disulfide oxidoreductase family protein [Rhizobium alarense]MCF3640115.1 DCC1-like thiol-disulfide oxidoreductase family protein [Rhizobium alarense]
MTVEPRRPFSYRDDPAVPPFPDDRPLVVFDGECGFCSRDIRFLLKHDRRGRYRFTPAQSPLGTALMRHYGFNAVNYETSLLIEDGRVHQRSAGVLRTVAGLGGAWRLARLLMLVPRPIRDFVYDRVAANRMRIAGRLDTCHVPPPHQRARFL